MSKIEKPAHYTAATPEVINIIRWAQHNLGANFECCCAIKYVFRAPLKGSYREDLEKALWYLEHGASWGDTDAELNTNQWEPVLGNALFNVAEYLLRGLPGHAMKELRNLIDCARPRVHACDVTFPAGSRTRVYGSVEAVMGYTINKHPDHEIRVRIDLIPENEKGDEK